jgi:hypothetical protein
MGKRTSCRGGALSARPIPLEPIVDGSMIAGDHEEVL